MTKPIHLLTCFTIVFTYVLGVQNGATLCAQDGFAPLFDGKSLHGWEGNANFWSVEDGTITGQTTVDNPTKGNTFLVWRGGEVKNFELTLEYRIVGGNSGIQYRSHEVERFVVSGYQADIDATNVFSGILYEEKGRGILAQRSKKVVVGSDGKPQDVGETVPNQEILDAIKSEDWNDYRIVANGNHLQHFINGKLTIDVTDNDLEKRKQCGLLALQLHAGPPMKIQFKNVRIKHLPETASEKASSDDKATLDVKASDNKAASTDTKHKKIVFVAGKPSHGYFSHEHNAGCLLLAKHLKAAMPDYSVDVHRNGWPENPDRFFAGADAIVMYCDGGNGHMAIPHLDEVDELNRHGTGIVCIHYAVEVPKEKAGREFLNWLGGYFEMDWSVNPHWTADFQSMPNHPITQGVAPFAIEDEWYFHMRFRDGMENVIPILSAIAPEHTMSRQDGPHSGNPHVRKSVAAGEPQHVAWASEQPGRGRGFGFTGGHFHANWGDDDFRKLVLNAILWTSGDDVPTNGVAVNTVTQSELEENQDEKKE